jgi:hypothetical protein
MEFLNILKKAAFIFVLQIICVSLLIYEVLGAFFGFKERNTAYGLTVKARNDTNPHWMSVRLY